MIDKKFIKELKKEFNKHFEDNFAEVEIDKLVKKYDEQRCADKGCLTIHHCQERKK